MTVNSEDRSETTAKMYQITCAACLVRVVMRKLLSQLDNESLSDSNKQTDNNTTTTEKIN